MNDSLPISISIRKKRERMKNTTHTNEQGVHHNHLNTIEQALTWTALQDTSFLSDYIALYIDYQLPFVGTVPSSSASTTFCTSLSGHAIRSLSDVDGDGRENGPDMPASFRRDEIASFRA